jgi:hypothetical protein
VIIFVVVLLMSSIVYAQDDAPADESDWEYVLAQLNGGPIYVVTPDDAVRYLTPDAREGYNTSVYSLISPMNQYAAFKGQVYGAESNTDLVVADLADGTCCTVLEEPFEITGFNNNVFAFNEDESLIFGSMDSGETTVLGTWDTDSGDLVNSVDLGDTSPPRETVTWDGDVISYTGFSERVTWNTATDELTAESFTPEETCNLNSIGTVEGIRDAYDPAYPAYAEPETDPETGEITFALSNVVTYRADYCDDSSEPVTVFHNPEQLLIHDAGWVLDGEAVLVRYADSDDIETRTILSTGTLVYRDGTTQTVEGLLQTPGPFYTTATGWLMEGEREEGQGEFVLYTVEDDTVTASTLATFDNSIVINGRLREPVFGSTLETTDFEVYVPPPPEAEATAEATADTSD